MFVRAAVRLMPGLLAVALLVAVTIQTSHSLSLPGPAGGAEPSVLAGTVTSAGSPIGGAVVTAGAFSATTDAEGHYTIYGVALGEEIAVRASAPGHFAQKKWRTLEMGVITADFDLVSINGNLLSNPGFDDGDVPPSEPGWPDPPAGWRDEIWGNYLAESWFAQYPDGAFYRSGEQAQAIVIAAAYPPEPQTGLLSQTVNVQPGTAYSAKVWARALGPSWGTNPSQQAALNIREIDKYGVVTEHPKVFLSDFAGWQQLGLDFVTGPDARQVVFGLWAHIIDFFNDIRGGRVIFDDAELTGPVGASPPALSGGVASGGVPLQGARVEILDSQISTTTDADGYWGIEVSPGSYTVRASKSGYYAQRKDRETVSFVSFDLVPVGNNLLTNAGMDDGFMGGGWSYDGEATPFQESVMALLEVGTQYASGEEAFDIINVGEEDAEGYVYQFVRVAPENDYIASVKFLAGRIDEADSAWGTDPRQKAALYFQEYDGALNPIGDETMVYATLQDIGDWEVLSRSFRTSEQTRWIAVGAFAHMVDRFQTTFARAIFDDFALRGPAPESLSAGQLKHLAEGSFEFLDNKVVTAAFEGYFYVEETDRSSGIRVIGTAAPGDVVRVSGVVHSIGEEATILATSVSIVGTAPVPAPLGVTNKAIGGADDGLTLGLAGGVGLNNIGLLVRTTGRVLGAETVDGMTHMLIDDGSGMGVFVFAAPGEFAQNDYVEVTGISIALGSGEGRTRGIRPRTEDDVVKH